MRNAGGAVAGRFGRLARVSMVGFAVQLIWVLVMGPVSLGKWERLSTWMSLTFAVVLVAFAASAAFKRLIEAESRQPSLPARVFAINLLSLLLVGFFLLIQLQSNPHILGNLRNVTDAALLGVELLLIFLSFIVNLIAFNRDRAAA